MATINFGIFLWSLACISIILSEARVTTGSAAEEIIHQPYDAKWVLSQK